MTISFIIDQGFKFNSKIVCFYDLMKKKTEKLPEIEKWENNCELGTVYC